MAQRKLKIEEIREILQHVKFPEYTFRLSPGGEEVSDISDARTGEPRKFYLQAEYVEADIITGKDELQKTRKWLLSPFMTRSEIVQTAFKCALTSYEHRAREHFTYRNQRVYSPHYDVEALVELCEQQRFDEREDWYLETDK